MRAFFRLSFLVIVTSLTACGGGGGGGGGGTGGSGGGSGGAGTADFVNVILEGRMAKGIIPLAEFDVFDINGGQISDLDNIAFGTTDTLGKFSEEFTMFDYTGPRPIAILMDQQPISTPAMICDFLPECYSAGIFSEAFGNEISTFGNDVIGFGGELLQLRTYLSSFGPDFTTPVNVSTLTTLAAAMADGLPGGATAQNIETAKTNIENMFGLTSRGIDINTTPIIDLTDAGEWLNASDNQRYHSVINAAIIGAARQLHATESLLAGLDPFYESFIIRLSELIADLRNNGEFGGDTSEYHLAGTYSVTVSSSSPPISSTFIGDVNDQGVFEGSIINGSEVDLLSFRVERATNSIVNSIEGDFTTNRFFTMNSDTVGGAIEATINDNGDITGTVSGSITGTFSGSALINDNSNFEINTNSGFDPQEFIDIADEQMLLLDQQYGT